MKKKKKYNKINKNKNKHINNVQNEIEMKTKKNYLKFSLFQYISVC